MESSRSKIKILAYQLELRGHLKIAKEKLQELKVNQQNINSRVAKEDLQQFEHQGSNPNVIKKR